LPFAALANPKDRREMLAAAAEVWAGKLHGLWYALGDADACILVELPHDLAAAGR